MSNGRLLIVSGPSGSGKDTILKKVFERVPEVKFSISSITRPMRPGEVEGEKYNFVSREYFEEMIKNDLLLEYNNYVGNYYGTPRGPVDEIIKNGGEFDKRSVMKVVVGDNKYYALNEALVQRCTQGVSMNEVAKLTLTIDNFFVDKLFADGIILSTPTGSTAYSLPFGGSIMTPDINAFIATPVCSHSLHSRPIVYSDSKVAKVKVLENSSKCALYVDGKFVKNLKNLETVEVSRSRKMIKFYKTQDNFFEKLLIKLNKWSETK